MIIKPSALLAALMIGSAASAPTAVAIDNPSQAPQANTLESPNLVAGRSILSDIFGRRPRSRFERFYRRNCRYRYSLRECYRLYEYKLEDRRFRRRRRRVFDRFDDRYGDRYERRHRRGDDDD